MQRRNFIRLAATGLGGWMVVPEFLHASVGSFGSLGDSAGQVLVFIQLNGGNDGLNTLIPYEDPLYYHMRPGIGIARNEIISPVGGLGFHPSMTGFAQIAQEGGLCAVQNVGYPNPNRSHFRSQEIWQTASDSDEYLTKGWLGRFLDIQCKDETTSAINVDGADSLALKSEYVNHVTVKDFNRLRPNDSTIADRVLSDNPQLDFARRVAYASTEGMDEIQKALAQTGNHEASYAPNALSRNLEWMSRLIKGGLNSKVYYTSLNGFDTHKNQLQSHARQLRILDEAVFSFYKDMKESLLLDRVTVVVFSEFGRRVQENGSGTDHGTAGPMFIIGGGNSGRVLGSAPDLGILDKGDLIHEVDFRAVYAALLTKKFGFDPAGIKIQQMPLTGIF